MLPRIVAIGDIDEDELAFADVVAGATAEAGLDLPPALSALERRMLLARLVLKWAASSDLHGSSGAPLVAHSPAAALALADDLGVEAGVTIARGFDPDLTEVAAHCFGRSPVARVAAAAAFRIMLRVAESSSISSSRN